MQTIEEAYNLFLDTAFSYYRASDYEKAQHYFKAITILQRKLPDEYNRNAISYYIQCKLLEIGRLTRGEGFVIEEENRLAFVNKTYKVYDINSTIQFGKYKGLTIKRIAKKDLQYISDQIISNPAFDLTSAAASFLIIELNLSDIEVFYQLDYKSSVQDIMLHEYDYSSNRFMIDQYDSEKCEDDHQQTWDDIYNEGGGKNEWSDPTQFWD